MLELKLKNLVLCRRPFWKVKKQNKAKNKQTKLAYNIGKFIYVVTVAHGGGSSGYLL